MDYRQWIGFSAVLAGLIVVVINYAQGDATFATALLIVVAILFGIIVWWTRPSRGGPHVSHSSAWATAGDDDVILYWRPG